MKNKVYALLTVTILAIAVVGIQFAQSAPRIKFVPAVVATFSGAILDVQPSPYSEVLLENEYPEIRRVSVSLLANFSSLDGQWVEILYLTPGGGAFPVIRLSNLDGTQKFETVEFNASRWWLRAFNNSNVNTETIRVDYTGTAIYSPS